MHLELATAPALTRYQQGRGIDPSRRELVGERPSNWSTSRPVTICDRCGLAITGNQWAFRQHQQSKRCLKAQHPAEAGPGKTIERGRVPQVTGADLDEEVFQGAGIMRGINKQFRMVIVTLIELKRLPWKELVPLHHKQRNHEPRSIFAPVQTDP